MTCKVMIGLLYYSRILFGARIQENQNQKKGEVLCYRIQGNSFNFSNFVLTEFKLIYYSGEHNNAIIAAYNLWLKIRILRIKSRFSLN